MIANQSKFSGQVARRQDKSSRGLSIAGFSVYSVLILASILRTSKIWESVE